MTTDKPAADLTHAEWLASGAPSTESTAEHPAPPPFTDAQAAASLHRVGKLVLLLTLAGLPFAWYFGGWRAALALLIGAAISGSGLWEWRRLMAALTARMDAAEAVQLQTGADRPKTPSIGFAITGFVMRLLLVVAVLYASLTYLHGSVAALAVGLAMSVVALTIEAVRLLQSGTI